MILTFFPLFHSSSHILSLVLANLSHNRVRTKGWFIAVCRAVRYRTLHDVPGQIAPHDNSLSSHDIEEIDDDVLTYASQHGRVTMSHVERKQAGDQNEEEEFIPAKAASFKIPVNSLFKCYGFILGG